MTSPRPPVSNATTARRLFESVEPIAVVTYLAPEPTEAVMALGAGTTWDASFAGRAAHERATTTLVLTALNHALRARDVRAGELIHHSCERRVNPIG